MTPLDNLPSTKFILTTYGEIGLSLIGFSIPVLTLLYHSH